MTLLPAGSVTFRLVIDQYEWLRLYAILEPLTGEIVLTKPWANTDCSQPVSKAFGARVARQHMGLMLDSLASYPRRDVHLSKHLVRLQSLTAVLRWRKGT